VGARVADRARARLRGVRRDIDEIGLERRRAVAQRREVGGVGRELDRLTILPALRWNSSVKIFWIPLA
jgi:hypothetical protein